MEAQTVNDIHQYRVETAQRSGGYSRNSIYDLIERVISSASLKGKVLDYGAGVGTLTRRLLGLNRFDLVAGTDIMKAPVDLEPEAEWIEQDLNVPLPDHHEAFDVVVAAEVIEHLENPRFMMREIFRILRPGGVVLITTPNNESWRSLITLLFRGNYAAFGEDSYPAHITPLLRKDLTRIFRETGFAAPDFYYTDEGAVPGKTSVTWQRISAGLFKGLRFSDNVMAVAKKPIN